MSASAAQPKLQSLFATISGAVAGGQLQLLPAWFPGNAPVNAALNALGAAAGLTIANVDPQYPAGAAQITITGTVTLGGTSFSAEVDIGLDSDQDYTIAIALPPGGDDSPLALTLPGAPWFALAKPSIAVSALPKLSGTLSGSITIGSAVCSASAALQPDGSWRFGLSWAAPGPSIEALFQFVGGIDLASVLPSPLNAITSLALRQLGFQYDFPSKTLQRFTIAMDATYPWDVFNNGQLVLETFAFSFVSDRVKNVVSWTAGTSIEINGKGPLDLTLSYASRVFTLAGVPATMATPLTLVDFVDAFLPSSAPQLPQSLSPGTVESFKATFARAAGKTPATYTVAVELGANTSWALSNTISVESLGFSIDATKAPVTGSITGQIESFKGQPQPLTLDVSAVYDGSEWVLETTQIGSTDVASILGGLAIPTPSQLNFSVSEFGSTIHTGSTSPSPYAVVSGSVQDFTMPFDMPVKLERVSGCFGVSLGSTGGALVSPSCLAGEVPLPFASITADTSWWGVPIAFGYEYTGSPAYTVSWVPAPGDVLVATIAKPDQNWLATIAFTGSTTVGSMVEAFVSWATGYAYGLAAPWTLLNDISLSGLSLQFDFTAKTVAVTLGFGIDLGFCSISGVTLTYNAGTLAAGTKRVEFALDGNFPWNAQSNDPDATTDKLSWDATKPESTKTPPGVGSGLLDLRLLALGQYVTIEGVAGAATVEAAMAAFEANAPAPPSGDTPQLPAVKYDPSTSWLIGLDIGLLQLGKDDSAGPGYAVTVQIVFDDPYLYGLRLALAGEPAKVFGGLDFEIMYRKISDTLGVYQAELTLPTSMRTIQTGIYTIVLPTFGIAVYTNGDFQIDVGFPWKADFSRSFTVEAIVAPGIPLLGAGGFYFGKLSSATSSSVPAATNGSFDPVIVFGFGAQVGFGKSVSIGPLSASFSLTVLAIIQGVLARWNGFTSSDQPAQQSSTQIDGAYYYSLTGTFGIAGTLSGAIDFGIIKASVNIAITVTAQITFAAYEPIVLTISARVSVSASLEINCGLFSFSISFHFALDLNETFSLPSPSSGAPPWQVAAPPQHAGVLARPSARMTRTRREQLRLRGALGANWNATPTWSNLSPAGGSVLPLQGYLTFALTAAADEYDPATNPTQVCYVATLAIDAQNAIALPSGASCAQPGDTSWEALCKLVARWVVAAFWSAPVGCDPTTGVDALVVTEAQLLTIHEYLANEGAQGNPLPNPVPLPLDPVALETMLEQQVALTLAGPGDGTPGTTTAVDAAFFPMPSATQLSIPAYGAFPGYEYSFGAYNTVAAADLPLLQAYFDQIAVQVQNEQKKSSPELQAAMADPTALSVGGFVFADYFLLIARQMIAGMQAGLRDYKYPYVADKPTDLPSVAAIVAAITAAGGMLAGEPDVPYTAADVFGFNPGLALATAQQLTIAGSTASVQAGDSFAAVAQDATYAGAFTAAQLALLNADNATLLQAGATVAYGGASLVADSTDTLTSLADRFTVLLGKPVQAADLAGDATIQQQQNLLQPLAPLALPPFPYTTGSADTVGGVAATFGVPAASLGAPLPNGDANPNAAVAGLFAPPIGSAYVDLPHLSQLQVGALLAETQQTGALATLSAMVSRFHLHGLRLPTVTGDPATPLIVPNAGGMWVSGSSGSLALPPAAGLFALTGQQFPIPAISSAPFTVTLGGGPSWIAYQSSISGTIAITNASDDLYDPAIEALRAVVTAPGYRFVSGYSVPGAQSQLERGPLSFSLGTHQNWIATALPPLPAPPPPAGALARLWLFPSGLSSILDRATHALDPNFVLQTQTYDQATGKTTTGSVSNYAWASTFEFTVKRLPTSSSVPATPGSPASGQTYQIAGANASTVVLLEDIVAQFPTDASLWGLWLAYAPDPSLRVSGLQACGAETVFGIGQANLSTVTRPPNSFTFLAEAEDETAPPPAGPAPLNGSATFVRLLWEASITNAGGFFLYYRDGDAGLPDRLFDDHGNAVLTGVLVYGTAADVSGGAPTALYDCMNAVVVTDPFDPAASALVAQAVPTLTPAPAAEPLAQIAAAYYADLADTAHRNAAVALAAVAFAVNGGTYMVPPPQLTGGPGNTLGAIASWFGTSAQAIQSANPGITVWPAQLAPNTALRLPALSVTGGATAGDGTTVLADLGTIASYFGADVVGLAVDNQNLAGLFAAALTVNAGPWSTASKLPPGSQLVQLQRDVPGNSDPVTTLMQAQFSLLGYRIVGNQDFQASNLGIPVGPVSAAGGSGVGKLRRANRLAASASGGWLYDVTLAYTGRLIGASPTASPYLAVGSLLQLDLGWYDYYGNTIASDLSTPQPGDAGPPNQTPLLLGYTDALIGLGQWPSANASWQVGGTFPNPQLQLTFSFDTTRYGGKDGPRHAAGDGALYARLLAQMPQNTANPGGDPNGAFSVDTSLADAPLPVADPNLSALTQWVVSIATYLQQVAAGQSPTVPAASLPLSFALSAASLPAEGIFELTCGFTLARAGGVVEGEFAALAGIRSTTTVLQPAMPATKAQRNGTAPGLVGFATSFENAYSGPDATLKVAVGPDRFAAGVASSSTMWAVKVGTAPTPLSFAVPDAGAPLVFAPQPITNQLVSNTAGIWPYASGTTIDFSKPPAYTKSFSGIDLDQWVRTLFDAVDGLLGPQYIAALVLLDQQTPGTLAALQAHKQSLAQLYAQQLALVFTDQTGSNEAVAALFQQAMYERLGNAYSTQAALQYTADVYAGTIETIPPNLYGPVLQTGTVVPGVAFTPAKLALQPPTQQVPAPSEPLAVLVTTPAQTGDTADRFVAVDLAYAATTIEHQIAPPDGSGYQASSWLQFVRPPASLEPSLGQADIPMILRAYPASPIMAAQTGPPTVANPATVGQATEWTYAFTYSLPSHYPQDVVTVSVEFNLEPTADLMAATFADSFAALAEFVVVYPEIVPDLEGSLATLSTSAPQAQFATALAAVQSVTAMLDRIAPVSDGEQPVRRFAVAPKRRAFVSSTGTTYTCALQETSAAEASPPAVVPGGDAGSLVIAVTVPAGGGDMPLVELSPQYVDPSNPGDAPYTTQPVGPPTVDPTTKATTQQYYVVDNATGKPLPFASAQSYQPRTVLYPGLQILDLQDAQASAAVTRNQQLVSGRTTAGGFVYQTPEVTFTAPCRPTIVQTSPIDVGAIAPPPPPAPHVPSAPRSLTDNLSALFYTLVGGASATSASFQIVIGYQYLLSGIPVTLPILMLPALPVSWASGDDTLAPALADLAAAISSWFDDVQPVGGGQVQLSLTVLTSVTQQLVPLVRLTSLEIALSDIANPPLTVATTSSLGP